MGATTLVVNRAAYFAIGTWLLVLMVTETAAAEQDSSEMELRTVVEDVELVVSADRKEMGISDQLTLRLTVLTPQGRLVAFPNASRNLGPFRVVGHTSVRPQAESDMEREEWREEYLLEADSAGEKTIRSMMITISAWSYSDSVACRLLERGNSVLEEKCDRTRRNVTVPETVTVKTPTLEFLVTTVLADDADLTTPLDIAPPVSIIKQPMPLGVWALIFGIAGLIGFCLWWLLRGKRTEVNETTPIGNPVHLIVLELLEKLRREDIDGADAIDHFYVSLSQVLRRYALWRFGINAPYQTTEELMKAVASSKGVLAEHRSFVGKFFRHCDAVKFAQYYPTDSSRYNFIDQAVRFVTVTADNTVLISSEEGKLS